MIKRITNGIYLTVFFVTKKGRTANARNLIIPARAINAMQNPLLPLENRSKPIIKNSSCMGSIWP
jgi:hypothetical protein